MSIWKILNWAAWALSAILLLAMLWDFARTERKRRSAEPAGKAAEGEKR